MEEGIQQHLLSDHDEVDDELQSILVHICFDLKDKPQELLNALEKIKVSLLLQVIEGIIHTPYIILYCIYRNYKLTSRTSKLVHVNQSRQKWIIKPRHRKLERFV